MKFKEIIEKVQSVVAWTVSKIKAAYTYLGEHKAEIKEIAEKVIAKVRELALSISRQLVSAFQRGQAVAYYADDACLCGKATLVQTFQHAYSIVKGMTAAEIAYLVFMVSQDMKVENAQSLEVALVA